jgi:metallo-beta-lactamase family protein
MKLTFWGAAGTVTGSMHRVETRGEAISVDCGYAGRRKGSRQKNRNLPFAGSSIDAVLPRIAHIDHSGNLPPAAWIRDHDPTPASIDLRVIKRDTAHIRRRTSNS